MSREEIDRIMNSDFSSVDGAIEKQLHAIDLMTGQISENSLFLAQFQKLLQKQLKPTKQDHLNQQFTQRVDIEDTTLELQNVKFQRCLQKDRSQHAESTTMLQIVPQPIDKQEFNNSRSKVVNIMQFFLKLSVQLTNIRHFLGLQAQQIKEYLQQIKQAQISQVKMLAQQVITMSRHNYEAVIDNLQVENLELKKEIQSLRGKLLQIQEQKHRQPLREIIECQNYPQHNIVVFQPKKLQNSSRKSEANNIYQLSIKQSPFPSIFEDQNKRSYQLYHTQLPPKQQTYYKTKTYSQSPQLQIIQNKTLSIPDIKPICVGIPPVKNGFGLLSLGTTTVYRGMWKHGKFSGKGILIWNNYTYEGDFQNGVFSGYGKLKMDIGTFMGKFACGKAEGEGTFQNESSKISGFWRNNCLIKPY